MSREAHVPFYEGLGVQFPRPTHRFGVRFRDAADLLAQHGLTVSDDAIRLWCLDFDSADARRLTRRQGRLGDIWHRDKTPRVERVAVVNQIAGASQAAIDRVGCQNSAEDNPPAESQLQPMLSEGAADPGGDPRGLQQFAVQREDGLAR